LLMFALCIDQDSNLDIAITSWLVIAMLVC